MAGKAIKIEVKGHKRIDYTLGQINIQLRGPILKKGLMAAGKVVEKEARRLAPRNKSGGGVDKPKTLKKAIKTVVREYPKVMLAVVGPAYPDWPNANWIEFGTEPHHITPRGERLKINEKWVGTVVNHPGAKPHPFMRPAAANTRPEQQRIMIETIQKEVNKVIKRG